MAISTRNIKKAAVTPFQITDVKLVVDIAMLGGAVQEVAADAVGTPVFSHTALVLKSEHLKHLKAAKFIIDYEWAATADGKIQLYDETAGAVLAESPGFIGGESDDWDERDVTGTLVAGNRIVVRADVTVAGAAGEKAKLYRAILRLMLEMS